VHLALFAVNYAPEQTGIAPFNTGLAEHLAAAGHRVSVVTTFPHYPEWRIAAEYRGRLTARERVNGVELHRLWSYVPRRRSTLRRIAYDSSLAPLALACGLALPRPDVVLAVSPPLQLAAAAALVARVRRARYVLQVKDLVPDIAVALGMLRNRAALAAARRLERFVYRRAEAILALCEGFADNLRAKGVPREKLAVLPDWTDTDAILPGERTNSFRLRLGISEDAFLLLHIGNMGTKQKLETALEAAAKFPPGALLLLVGDGAERAALEARARALRLENVRFLPLVPAEELPALLAAADALLLSQARAVVDMVIPSKLLTYMAAGRAVIAAIAAGSEAARAIRAAGCGAIVPPEEPAALAEAVRSLRDNPAAAARMGAAGRRFAEAHFARARVLARYADFFSAFAEGAPARTPEPLPAAARRAGS
jgi:colanic acid biosynthesis glycosyl transferase WcaI